MEFNRWLRGKLHRDYFQDVHVRRCLSTNESKRRRAGLSLTRGYPSTSCPSYQHGDRFSLGPCRFDASTKFVHFFGDGLNLIEHQAGNDQTAPMADRQARVWMRLSGVRSGYKGWQPR